MKLIKYLSIGALSLSLLTGHALAQDKAAKQAEVRKVAAATLEKFYAKKPELKAALAKAPGYAVFTTYGLSFLVGGSGGSGIVHDNKTKQDVFMKMGAGSVGFQIGAAESDMLIVFNTEARMKQFIDNGWTFGGGAEAGAGGGGKSVGGGSSAGVLGDVQAYTLTKAGLTGDLLSIGSAKVWKDADLN
ncbi:MAG TPA: YSC84-related protein [Rubrivivax sp.]|nr:YSC84-related protein [Rubrivivax sp.]HPO19465.1 YSC84-related protein [Rubrivivax sp.]